MQEGFGERNTTLLHEMTKGILKARNEHITRSAFGYTHFAAAWRLALGGSALLYLYRPATSPSEIPM